MKKWHVLTSEGWITVESEDRPEGSLVHAVQETCLNWDCGWSAKVSQKIQG